MAAERTGVYPGTFDPITSGHMEVVRRSLRLVDRLVIGPHINVGKGPLFSLEERIEIGREQGRVELDQRADRDDGEGQVRNAADVRSWPYGMIKAVSLLAPLRVRSRWVTGSPGTRPRAELSLADLLAV